MHRSPSNCRRPTRPSANKHASGHRRGAGCPGSRGMTPSKFIEYIFIGFGATVGFILLAVAMWVLIRRHLHRRRQARLLHGAAPHRPDARRQQTEAVQRMIEEKRKAARAARKPVLVVHPGKRMPFLGRFRQQYPRRCTHLPRMVASFLVAARPANPLCLVRSLRRRRCRCGVPGCSPEAAC